MSEFVAASKEAVGREDKAQKRDSCSQPKESARAGARRAAGAGAAVSGGGSAATPSGGAAKTATRSSKRKAPKVDEPLQGGADISLGASKKRKASKAPLGLEQRPGAGSKRLAGKAAVKTSPATSEPSLKASKSREAKASAGAPSHKAAADELSEDEDDYEDGGTFHAAYMIRGTFHVETGQGFQS